MAIKPKFFQVKIFNTPVLADALVSGRKAQITGLQDIDLDNVQSFVAKAFNAGTKAVKDIDFAGITVLNNSNYRLKVLLLDGLGTERIYFFNSDATATAAEIRTGFLDAINADTSRDVDATDGGGDIMRLTGVKVDFDFDVDDPAGISIAVITPHVAPAGTFAIAQTFDSVNASSGANYKTYEIVHRVRERNAFIGGAFVTNERKTVVFSEQTSTPGFTLLDARLLQVFTPTQLDAILQDGALAASSTEISADTTMTGLNNLVTVDSSGSDIDVTLEDSATLGSRVMVFVNKTGANSIIFKKQGSDTLNGGAGDVTVTIAKSAIVINDGAGAYLIVEFA